MQDVVLPGQYFDQETNLHYNYFRDYDPSTGRYIQSDPIGLEGGINTYSYVLQSPFKYRDPSGLFSVSNKTGQSRDDELGTVVCSGDNANPFKPEIFIPEDDCRYVCAYKHEERHIEDIYTKRDENICRDMKPGLRVVPKLDGVEGPWTERNGYQTELECNDALLTNKGDCLRSKCKPIWIERHTVILLLMGRL